MDKFRPRYRDRIVGYYASNPYWFVEIDPTEVIEPLKRASERFSSMKDSNDYEIVEPRFNRHIWRLKPWFVNTNRDIQVE